ncbi:MAG TPA: hypothetical protein PLL64_05435 [Rhodothermales bacterium]|nr:hypothetical protein [Rhodothermales bacterium]HRR08524.1 hypothetical protein [Rhodothermales bacterium]
MKYFFLVGWCALVFMASGCDVHPVEADTTIRPKLQIGFVTPRMLDGSSLPVEVYAKTEAIWTVKLTITSKGGRDYSPKEAITADNTTQDEVFFDLQLPLDSTFTFRVEYSQNGRTRAHGQTVQRISRDNYTVYMQAVFIPENNTTPIVGFGPSIVSVKSNSGELKMALMIDGTSDIIKAIAGKMNISGIDPSRIRFKNALTVRQGYGVDVAWAFPSGKRAPFVLDTLYVPLDTPADIEMKFQQGTLQLLTNPNTVRSYAVTDARVIIK